MALLCNQLTAWEISFRWAGYDPRAMWLRLPLPVHDYARLLIGAIYHGELSCSTLMMEKWSEADGEEMKPYFIRHHLRDIWDCEAGRPHRRLLKWAVIDRWALKEWCEGHTIPLPEFWFPPSWRLTFDWTIAERIAEEQGDASPGASKSEPGSVRASARTRIACQEIAKSIWRDQAAMTIADMIKHDAIQRLCGAAVYTPTTVREWLSEVAPSEVKQKRGRPRKKNQADDRLGDAETEA